ncbi:hypothetical protein EXU34_12850 [Alteromonas sp. ZYF713]|nr:hypothetical protein [Alteromonas sp. ZYF713]
MKFRDYVAFGGILMALSGCGGGGDENPPAPTPTPTPSNQSPTVNAGADTQGNEGDVISIDASANDSDGQISLYQWSQSSGPEIIFQTPNNEDTQIRLPEVSTTTVVEITLTVTDDDGAESSDSINITIVDIDNTGGNTTNQPPQVDAGNDQTVQVGDTVTLTGSATDDGEIASYLWTQSSGPSVTLNNSNNPSTSFTAPSVSENTTLSFTLTVTDDEDSSSNDNVTVTVQAPASNPDGIAGEFQWEVSFDAYPTQPMSVDANENVYACMLERETNKHRLTKISAIGNVEWINREFSCLSSASVNALDVIYVDGRTETNSGLVFAINPEDGSVVWSKERFINGARGWAFASTPTGKLVTGGGDFTGIIEYNKDGTEMWRFPTNSTPGSVVYVSENTVLFYDTNDLVALQNGSELWRTNLNDIDITTIYPHPDGILITDSSSGIHFLNDSGNTINWSITNSTNAPSSEMFGNEIHFAKDGTIWFQGRSLYEINPTDGSFIAHDNTLYGFNGRFMPISDNAFFIGDPRLETNGIILDKTGTLLTSTNDGYYTGDESNDFALPGLGSYIVTPDNTTYLRLNLYDSNIGSYNSKIVRYTNRDVLGEHTTTTKDGDLTRSRYFNAADSVSPDSNFTITSPSVQLLGLSPQVILPNGALNTENYNPAYRFILTEDTNLSMTLRSDTLDTVAYIIDGDNGNVLHENNDSNNTTNSQIDVSLSAGNYIAVAGADSDSFGNLTIEMSFNSNNVMMSSLRTGDPVPNGSTLIQPDSVVAIPDLPDVVSNISENPNHALEDDSNFSATPSFFLNDNTYGVDAYTYTTCDAGGIDSLTFTTPSGVSTGISVPIREGSVFSDLSYIDTGNPSVGNATILVRQVSANGRFDGTNCEAIDAIQDNLIFDENLNLLATFSQQGIENWLSKRLDADVNAIRTTAFLYEDNSFSVSLRTDDGTNYQVTIPADEFGDYEALFESYFNDPNFDSGEQLDISTCELSWTGFDDTQLRTQCATACVYQAAGVTEGASNICAILGNLDAAYPSQCSVCD